jgi:hypothetical protein
MRLANPNLGATSVMFVVMKKRAKLLALLTKNGVKYPANATDMQLALIVTNLLKTSKSFRIEFNQLLLEPEVIESVLIGMDGFYSNFDFDTKQFDENIFATKPKAPSPPFGGNKPNTFGYNKPKPYDLTLVKSTDAETKPKNKFNLDSALKLLQTGFAGYLALDENKTKKALADASVQIKQTDVKLAELGVLPSGNLPKKEGLSTGAIIGISLAGILVLGGVIYFATKKSV